MVINRELIDYLISNSGGPVDGETWYDIGVRFGITPPNQERARNNDKYRKKSIATKTQDIWRSYLDSGRTKKRLFFDIETSYNIVKAFHIGRKVNLTTSHIIHERAIICICYKWEGSNKVHSLVWDQGCDKKLIHDFLLVLEEADELVGHNIDRFDVKWIFTRAIKHGLKLFPSFGTTDTLKIARKHFNFNSNKLDYIGQFLGLGAKVQHRGLQMWDDIILRGDEKALKEMVEYCKGDVILTEDVFRTLNNYSETKYHHHVLANNNRCSCPECGEDNNKLIKTLTTKVGMIKRLMECNSCGNKHYINNTLYLKNYA